MKVYVLEQSTYDKHGEFSNSEICGVFKTKKALEKSLVNFLTTEYFTGDRCRNKYEERINNKCKTLDEKLDEYEEITGNRFHINEYEIDSTKYFDYIV